MAVAKAVRKAVVAGSVVLVQAEVVVVDAVAVDAAADVDVAHAAAVIAVETAATAS